MSNFQTDADKSVYEQIKAYITTAWPELDEEEKGVIHVVPICKAEILKTAPDTPEGLVLSARLDIKDEDIIKYDIQISRPLSDISTNGGIALEQFNGIQNIAGMYMRHLRVVFPRHRQICIAFELYSTHFGAFGPPPITSPYAQSASAMSALPQTPVSSTALVVTKTLARPASKSLFSHGTRQLKRGISTMFGNGASILKEIGRFVIAKDIAEAVVVEERMATTSRSSSSSANNEYDTEDEPRNFPAKRNSSGLKKDDVFGNSELEARSVDIPEKRRKFSEAPF